MNARKISWCIAVLVGTMRAGTVFTQPANSPWPMFCGNAARTGLSPYAGPIEPVLEWSYETGGEVWSSPAIGIDGSVFITDDSRLYRLDSSGGFLWSHSLSASPSSSPSIGSDSTCYIGYDSGICAFGSAGIFSWSYVTGSLTRSSPVIDSTGMIYCGNYDNRLCALDPLGALAWSYETAQGITYASPSIRGDGTVLQRSQDDQCYAINPDGSLLWSYSVGGMGEDTVAVDSGGKAYVLGSNRAFMIEPDGGIGWTCLIPGMARSSSPGIGSDGRISFGLGFPGDGIYSITSAGNFSWSYRTGEDVFSSPAIGSDGMVYVGSADNVLYALGSSGTLAWSYVTGAFIFSSPALDGEGRLCIGSRDTRIYMFGQDPRYRSMRINFQPDAVPTPLGFMKDSGQTFDSREGYEYGWR